jgi:SpoVK/Ycf46/Vps4 family AAA+-type ATPase
VETAAGVLSAEQSSAELSELTSGATSTSEDDLWSRWDARNFDGNPALRSLFELIALPILRRRDFEALGVECPKGILLSGPPGVGKTWAVRTVVNKLGVKMISVDASNITGSGMAGDSEARLRDVFRQARSTGGSGSLEPCIIFIDEIDVLCGKRGGDGSSASGNRLVAQLLTLMDGMDTKAQNGLGGSSRIVVVGATNMPNAIDPALRRPGRFEREVCLSPPGPEQREAILKHYLSGLRVSPAIVLKSLAERCVGFLGADIEALCRQACLFALDDASKHISLKDVDDGREGTKTCSESTTTDSSDGVEALILSTHMKRALQVCHASSLRGAMQPQRSNVTWDSIGGLEDVKRTLRMVSDTFRSSIFLCTTRT